MDNVLEFNRKKIEDIKEQRSISQQMQDIDNEIKGWEDQRVLLKRLGADAFIKDEADEKKRNMMYMAHMSGLNEKITELRLELKRLSKELKLP